MIATFLGTVVRESSQLQKSDAELFEEMFLHRSAGFLDCDFRILFDFILVLPILIVTKPPKEVSPLPPDFLLKIETPELSFLLPISMRLSNKSWIFSFFSQIPSNT